MDQLGTLFQIFFVIAAACITNFPNCREPWTCNVMAQPPHRRLRREYLTKKCKLLRGGECSKGRVGGLCAAGGPRKGMTILTDVGEWVCVRVCVFQFFLFSY